MRSPSFRPAGSAAQCRPAPCLPSIPRCTITAGKDAAFGFLTNHFTDHSQKLNLALQRANDRAWKALEIALSGDSWWSRCRSLLVPGDEKAVGQQIQAFLDAVSLPDLQNRQ